jgi:TetR/AcrR family tetracycline transcriptional repressor
MATPTGARRPGPRRSLAEDDVLDAALSLLDAGGVAAVSVRGIAAKVGVAPNAVYTYFPDKAAVVRGLVDRLVGDADEAVAADRGRPWRERIEVLTVELRANLSAHPGAVGLAVGGPLDGPRAQALDGHLRDLLTAAGLPPADATRGAHLLIGHVLGSILLEAGQQSTAVEQYRWQLHRLLDGLAAERSP